jgi:hypothetical protein
MLTPSSGVAIITCSAASMNQRRQPSSPSWGMLETSGSEVIREQPASR